MGMGMRAARGHMHAYHCAAAPRSASAARRHQYQCNVRSFKELRKGAASSTRSGKRKRKRKRKVILHRAAR